MDAPIAKPKDSSFIAIKLSDYVYHDRRSALCTFNGILATVVLIVTCFTSTFYIFSHFQFFTSLQTRLLHIFSRNFYSVLICIKHLTWNIFPKIGRKTLNSIYQPFFFSSFKCSRFQCLCMFLTSNPKTSLL